jgi:hypothetical protein
MDVLNIISWLKSKRQVTTVDASQTLIPLGLKDPRRDDGYLPGAISVTDFLDLVPAPVPPTDALENTFVGEDAFADNISGSANAFFGWRAGYTGTNQVYNTGIGRTALYSNTTGSENTAIGVNSSYNNINGIGNASVGNNSLYFNISGNSNSCLGISTLFYNTTGQRNIAIGENSLYANTTGQYNIAIGASAGNSNTTGQYNIMIGSAINNQNYNNCIILGKQAQATANNQFVVGSSGTNAGTIATEALTPTVSWTVKINGVDYKIPLQIA